MNRVKKILIITNPASGSFSASKLELAKKTLEAANFMCDVGFTDYSRHAEKIAEKAKGYDVICAMGGDGTISEVLSGLEKQKFPPLFAILPTGTANVLAIELGLKNFKKALLAIIAGKSMKIFLGEAENGEKEKRLFTLGSVGLDASAVKMVNLNIKRWFGKLAYIISGFSSLFAPKKEFEITFNGSKKVRGFWLVFVKGRHYAGRFKVASDIDIKKPEIRLIIFKKAGFFRNIFNTFLLFSGLFKLNKNVVCKTVSSFEIKPISDSLDIEIDGDILSSEFTKFRVNKKTFKIISK